MSIDHEDCRSARSGFSRCGGFQIVRAVCPTRRLHVPVGETLAAPESGATWAKRARDEGKRAVPAPSSERPFTDQAARCSLYATKRKFLLYAKAARREARLLSNPRGIRSLRCSPGRRCPACLCSAGSAGVRLLCCTSPGRAAPKSGSAPGSSCTPRAGTDRN